jgi:hypothetical protein
MKLVPIRPPGPNARKARAFEAEIRQLRARGYTFEAIREALAGAGVHVSNSTVQREVARANKSEASASPTVLGGPSDRPALSLAPVVHEPPATLRGNCATDDRRSGKDLAEAFVRSQSTNPLIRTKEQP